MGNCFSLLTVFYLYFYSGDSALEELEKVKHTPGHTFVSIPVTDMYWGEKEWIAHAG